MHLSENIFILSQENVLQFEIKWCLYPEILTQ